MTSKSVPVPIRFTQCIFTEELQLVDGTQYTHITGTEIHSDVVLEQSPNPLDPQYVEMHV
jgi:hypothetical protein